ncbi:hypothetical protein H0H93_000252 [Arthromyces matolae]|nr:hypothetical protein H0H93_000252 [Arthromyces matolae]
MIYYLREIPHRVNDWSWSDLGVHYGGLVLDGELDDVEKPESTPNDIKSKLHSSISIKRAASRFTSTTEKKFMRRSLLRLAFLWGRRNLGLRVNMSPLNSVISTSLTLIMSFTPRNDAKAPQQPDIQYHPDEAKWKSQTARRLAEDSSLLKASLPDGWPTKLVESPLVWQGSDWRTRNKLQWTYELNEAQLKEIDDGLRHFRGPQLVGLNKPLGHISMSTFPLPLTLDPILADLTREFHTGRGFFVLHTIPVDSYTRKEIIYTGVCSHVGDLRVVQDPPPFSLTLVTRECGPLLAHGRPEICDPRGKWEHI